MFSRLGICPTRDFPDSYQGSAFRPAAKRHDRWGWRQWGATICAVDARWRQIIVFPPEKPQGLKPSSIVVGGDRAKATILIRTFCASRSLATSPQFNDTNRC